MTNPPNRPILAFELNKKYTSFLEYLFGKDENGVILLTNGNPVGKMINSLWETSPYPVNTKFENEVRVYLPIHPGSNYRLKFNFIYIDKWKTEQLRIFIESYFEIVIREFFVNGYEKHYQKKTIIEMILADLNRYEYSFTYDQISKFDYRNRVKIVENIRFDIKKSRKSLIIR